MKITGHYWQEDQPDTKIATIIGTPPKRWGRMNYTSRIAIVEIGQLLAEAQLLNNKKQLPAHIHAGLIVGTKRGSLATDLEFCKGLQDNHETASPLLFSYTLPNTPLSEAANQYQIKGPVYSMYSSTPFATAIKEGDRWIKNDPNISIIIAGELDFYSSNNQQQKPEVAANFIILK